MSADIEHAADVIDLGERHSSGERVRSRADVHVVPVDVAALSEAWVISSPATVTVAIQLIEPLPSSR